MENTNKIWFSRDSEQVFPNEKTRRKTVLFFSNSLPYFLAHRSNLLRPLMELELRIVLVTGGVTPELTKDLPDEIVLVPLLLDRHTLALRTDLAAIAKLLKAIKQHSPDVVHSITIKPNMFSAVCLSWLGIRGVKPPRLVITFPGLGRVFEGDSRIERVRRFLVAGFLTFGLKKLDYVATFENDADKAELTRRKIIDQERARVLMGAGIDLSNYFPTKQPKKGRLTFLCASRLLVQKGIPEYVAACNSLAAEGVNAEFLLAGPTDPGYPGNYDPNAATMSGSLGVVRYLGAIAPEDMAGLLRTCDVVCSPSRLREGFPRILIEAAACGAALISSDQTSVYPIVHHGQTGWLVDMADPLALLNAMREAAVDADRTRSIGQSATELMRRLPAGDAEIAAQFLSFYFPDALRSKKS